MRTSFLKLHSPIDCIDYVIGIGNGPGSTIDSIVKGLETDLINTFPADSPRCAVDNIVDSFHGCF